MKSNPRVLFVGHDPADASLLELVLTHDLPSAEVAHISDPVSFGREIERADFDLVVCDERLDWTDGTGVLLQIESRRPSVPVVILSQETPGRRPGTDQSPLAKRLDKSARPAFSNSRRSSVRPSKARPTIGARPGSSPESAAYWSAPAWAYFGAL